MLSRTSGTATRLAFARSAAFCIPASGKASPTGEDGFYISRSGRSLGVADGVGGWADQGVDPSIFTRKFMRYALEKADEVTASPSSSTSSTTNENKAAVPPSLSRYTSSAIMHHAFDLVMKDKLLGSCAALFATLESDAPATVPAATNSDAAAGTNKKKKAGFSDAPTGPFATLNVASIGDCGVAVVRAGMGVVFASREQQRSFNFPYQLGPEGDTPAAALISDFCVAHGDVVILGSDGVFDNVYCEMLPGIVTNEWRKSLPKNVDPRSARISLEMLPPLNCAAVAENIAKLAYQSGKDREHLSPFSLRAKMVNVQYEGGKPDDITVVVAQVMETVSSGDASAAAAAAEGKSTLLEVAKYSLIEEFFEQNPLSQLKSKL